MPTATQQQQQLEKIRQQIHQQNVRFMKYSFRQFTLADAQNGTAYAVGGNPLNFICPIIEGGFAERIIIRTTLNFTYTPAGSSPYVNLTAAGAYAIFKEVEVVFGNTVIKVHPYIAHILNRIWGYLREYPGQTIGYQAANIQNLIYQLPAIASGANTWQFDIDIPLNTVHPLSVAGLLPIMGSGTRLQINVTPAPAIVGKDPLNNAIDTNGTIENVTGTVQVIVVYRDYKSFWTRDYLAPNLDSRFVPSVQWIKPQEINPLTAGSPMFKRLENPYEFAKIVSIVIDGQSSGTFCAANNIQLYEIDRAENTSSVLRKFDSTNGGMANYYRMVRDRYGQDLPEGVLVFDAVSENTADPSLQDGVDYLNLTAAGFPAARLGFQVGAVSSSNTTPRVVTYGVILNRQGLQIA